MCATATILVRSPISAVELVHQQLAAIVDRRNPEPRAGRRAEQLPGDDVRVVLHRRDDDLVAGAHPGGAERVSDEVDALGGIAR